MRRLIVTADDFGAAACVNEAVEQAHRGGVLTAASLMVGAPAAEDAVARAKALPSLRVGLHLVLVEGRPVLPATEVPDLTDAGGQFRTDMAGLGADIFFRPSVRRQMEAEVLAQFEAFAATGLPLDHVNTHKHFHLHPTILGAILRIGPAFGMTALRIPLEPGARSPVALITRPWATLARSRVRRAGIGAPDHVFGLQWSGAMTAKRLEGILRQLPPGLSEIYLHPATADSYPGSAPGYRYVEEFQALIDPEVAQAARGEGRMLGGFADFA